LDGRPGVTGTVDFHFFRAESGDAHGQYDLAKMYLDGYLVDKNLDKALYWLKKAADQKFKRAQSLLENLTR
jgi:TPR repeat protein